MAFDTVLSRDQELYKDQDQEKSRRKQEMAAAELAQEEATSENDVEIGQDKKTMFDRVAHHLSHRIAGMRLCEAERLLQSAWAPHFREHQEDEESMMALGALDEQIVRPTMGLVQEKARQDLKAAGWAWYQENVLGQETMAHPLETFRAYFLEELAPQVLGEHRWATDQQDQPHPLALAVFEGFLAPLVARLKGGDGPEDRLSEEVFKKPKPDEDEEKKKDEEKEA